MVVSSEQSPRIERLYHSGVLSRMGSDLSVAESADGLSTAVRSPGAFSIISVGGPSSSSNRMSRHMP